MSHPRLTSRRPAARGVAVACLLAVSGAVVACTDSRAAARAPSAVGDGDRPSEARVTGHLRRDELVESSGTAASVAQPGVLFTINDSGNDPVLYATDTTGADRGAWRVTGATNIDWESIAMGPCVAADGTLAGGPPRCVYIGDTGDNVSIHRSRVVYRVAEPTATGAGLTGATEPAARLEYAYDGGARDVEAMTVGPNGEIALYTKRPHRDDAGRLRPSLVHRIPAMAWRGPQPARAALADSLPAIVPGTGSGGSLVTDASLSADARRLAVRTYTQLFVFASDPATGRTTGDEPLARCDVSALEGDIGEGVAWLADGRLALTSEGRGSAVNVVRCEAAGGR